MTRIRKVGLPSGGTTGQVLKKTTGSDFDTEWGTAGGSGGHTIEDEGTPLTARTKLNFVGAGVTVTDDAGDDASVVTIPGGGSVAWGGITGTLSSQTDLQAALDGINFPLAVSCLSQLNM